MGTNCYFEEHVVDALSDEEIHLEVGTNSASGEGPQMYLNLGTASVLLSHEDAKKFAEAVENVAFYFQNWKE